MIERRYIPAEAIEVRIKKTDGGDLLEGYAAVFNSWGEGFGFREKIRSGAFKRTIKNADIRGLKNHNPDMILSRNTAGTLRLAEDKKGLHYEMDLGQTYATDLRESVERGDITGNSFSFEVTKNGDEWNDEKTERVLTEVKLFDVGPVTFPFYEGTSLGLRSALTDNGFDVEMLSGILIRAERGIKLAESDIKLINSSIEILRRCLPVNDPDPEPMLHSTRRLKNLLNELELSEFE